MYSNLGRELRDIFHNYSEFQKIASTCGDSLKELSDNTRTMHEEVLSARNKYAQKLHQLMTTRNITEEKLKRSQDAIIELSKFKVYDSKHDIYSFRLQFEKLIQPGTQKK